MCVGEACSGEEVVCERAVKGGGERREGEGGIGKDKHELSNKRGAGGGEGRGGGGEEVWVDKQVRCTGQWEDSM